MIYWPGMQLQVKAAAQRLHFRYSEKDTLSLYGRLIKDGPEVIIFCKSRVYYLRIDSERKHIWQRKKEAAAWGFLGRSNTLIVYSDDFGQAFYFKNMSDLSRFVKAQETDYERGADKTSRKQRCGDCYRKI